MKTLRIVTGVLVLALSGCGPAFTGAGAEAPPPVSVRGSGKVVELSRAVSGFDTVSLAGIGEMRVVLGTGEGLRIEAEDNIAPLLRTEVQGGTLAIRFGDEGAPLSISPTRPVRLTVTVKRLAGLILTGDCSVDASAVESARLATRITGNGRATVWATESLEVRIVGTGAVSYYGTPAIDRSILGLGTLTSLGGK